MVKARLRKTLSSPLTKIRPDAIPGQAGCAGDRKIRTEDFHSAQSPHTWFRNPRSTTQPTRIFCGIFCRICGRGRPRGRTDGGLYIMAAHASAGISNTLRDFLFFLRDFRTCLLAPPPWLRLLADLQILGTDFTVSRAPWAGGTRAGLATPAVRRGHVVYKSPLAGLRRNDFF